MNCLFRVTQLISGKTRNRVLSLLIPNQVVFPLIQAACVVSLLPLALYDEVVGSLACLLYTVFASLDKVRDCVIIWHYIQC